MLEAARQNKGTICQIYDHYMFSRQTVYHNFGIIPVRQIIKPLATPNEIDLVVGQPYCGNFSSLGWDRGKKNNPTTSIDDITYFINGVNAVLPRAFIMENLPKSLKFLPVDFYKDRLRHYNIYTHILDYFNYGVPQIRKRLLVVGIHRKSKIDYDPAWVNDASLRQQGKILREAIGDLPPEKDIPEINHVHWLSTKFLEGKINFWFNYMPKAYSKYVQKIDENHLKIDGKIYRREDFLTGKHPGFYKPDLFYPKLLYWDKPSPTIAHEHIFNPINKMALTVRERARLQTFPDDFIFYGSLSSQLIQTSRTVPVKIIKIAIQQLIKAGL